MLKAIEQWLCGWRGHQYIRRNRNGNYHVECMVCLDKSNGIVERLQR